MPKYNDSEKAKVLIESATRLEQIYLLAAGRDLNAAELEILDQSLNKLSTTVDTLREALLPLPKDGPSSLLLSNLRKVARSTLKGAIVGTISGGLLSPPSRITANAAEGAAIGGSRELAEITNARQEIRDSIEAVAIIYDAAAKGRPISAEDQKVLQTNLENIARGAQLLLQHLRDGSKRSSNNSF